MAFISIILGTFLWSIDTLIRYPLLGQLSAGVIVLLEHIFLVSLFIPLLFIYKFKISKIKTPNIWAFVIIGCLGSAASTLAFTQAFNLINPSVVILLQKLQPFVAISLSALILKEKLNKSFFMYAFIAFCGAFIISFPDLINLFNTESKNNELTGYALALFAVLGWGASTVYGKQLSKNNFSEYEIMAGRFIFGFIFLAVYSVLFVAKPVFDLSFDLYMKIFGMVLLSGLLGMYLYYKGLKKLSAHNASIAELFFPLSAVLVNWVFLGQALKPMQILGRFLAKPRFKWDDKHAIDVEIIDYH
jgi:drug/metabolite transporter (DMT)-like permease